MDYWTKSIEGKTFELEKPNLCENKLSIIIQEELFRSLKIETEELVKNLVVQLNDLKTSIKVNEAKLIQEKEDYENNTDQLIGALELEKERIKQLAKIDSGSELNGLQARGEAVKSNLHLQLQSLNEINSKLNEQNYQFTVHQADKKRGNAEKLRLMEVDMIKNYEINGNETLGKIESAYINTLKNQESQIAELRERKFKMDENIKRLESKKKDDIRDLSRELKS